MKKIALLIIMGLAIACSDQSEQSAPATEVDKLPLVQLRIETPEGKDPVDASVEYSQGTVLSLMQAAREQKLIEFTSEGEGEKTLIQSIQGIGPSGDGDKAKYWIYAVNGKMANLGVGSQNVQSGDEVRWCYLSYEERKKCAENQ